MNDKRALESWIAMTSGSIDGWVWVRTPAGATIFLSLRSQLDCVGRFVLDNPRDLVMGMAPRDVGREHAIREGQVLWAVFSGSASEGFLRRFRPAPTFVLREGASSRRTAAWALDRPLGVNWLERANRRIAHRLRAPKKTADPITLVAPPCALVVGERRKPVPVTVEHASSSVYRIKDVVQRLPDAPDPDAWRKAAA